MKIGTYQIGPDQPPFIIAEMSGNHNGDKSRALALVKAAAASGAHALKLQTYTADTITMNVRGGLFTIDNPKSIWNGYNLYDLYQEAHTPWEWHAEIFDYARSLGMEAFSSPFDETAVDFLETLDVPAYKIASFESGHHPLLRKVAATGKPIIISSGTSTLNEIYESVAILKQNAAGPICVLKCTSTYPATPENTNLRTIPVFQSVFPDCIVGLSDHTMGIGVSIAAVALGASVVEKHFTLDRNDGGVDSEFSLEPAELKSLVTETKRAWQGLGGVQLDTQKSEEASRQFRRSIYVSKDIKRGELLTKDNLKIIRPGDGLSPAYWESVLGKLASKDYIAGTPFK